SSRLVELLLRWFGRLRGGLNLIMVVAMAFFSGISGSKLADVAAVGGILMPAVRKTRQDVNEATGLLAATAIMAETIPPCVIMFIVAAASGLAYSLTVEQVPHALAKLMIDLAHAYGNWLFMAISVLALIVFGAVLEGAPALIIFGPLLTPIATQLGYHPLHFG